MAYGAADLKHRCTFPRGLGSAAKAHSPLGVVRAGLFRCAQLSQFWNGSGFHILDEPFAIDADQGVVGVSMSRDFISCLVDV